MEILWNFTVDAEMAKVETKQKNLVKFFLSSNVQKVTIHLSNLDTPIAEIEFTGRSLLTR